MEEVCQQSEYARLYLRSQWRVLGGWRWQEMECAWWFKVTFLGCLSDLFKGLRDLQLGDEKVTNWITWWMCFAEVRFFLCCFVDFFLGVREAKWLVGAGFGELRRYEFRCLGFQGTFCRDPITWEMVSWNAFSFRWWRPPLTLIIWEYDIYDEENSWKNISTCLNPASETKL